MRVQVPKTGGGSSFMGGAAPDLGSSLIGRLENRLSRDSLGFGRTQHVCEHPVGAWDSCRQLAEPVVGGENIGALSETRVEHATEQGLFARIVRLQNAL